jgi:hypothetical protein
MAPKKVNSDAVKLRMQQKADAKLIAHHKAINKHWKGVRYWTVVEEYYRENDDENQEPQYRQYSYPFTAKEPVGPVFSKFHRVVILLSSCFGLCLADSKLLIFC